MTITDEQVAILGQLVELGEHEAAKELADGLAKKAREAAPEERRAYETSSVRSLSRALNQAAKQSWKDGFEQESDVLARLSQLVRYHAVDEARALVADLSSEFIKRYMPVGAKKWLDEGPSYFTQAEASKESPLGETKQASSLSTVFEKIASLISTGKIDAAIEALRAS
jgi:hypothetical protein